MVERDKKLTIRIAEAELSMLEALAEVDGVSQSDYVRLFIRRAYAEKFPEKKNPKKR
jgi:hypothetical protein